ncbi:MAG: RDD family protein [Acidimicrobiia bacterium]
MAMAMIAYDSSTNGSRQLLLVTLGPIAVATVMFPSAIALSSTQNTRVRGAVLATLSAAGTGAGAIIGGHDDPLRGLVLVEVALLAFFIAWVLWLWSAVTRRRLESRRANDPIVGTRRAGAADRLAASSIDIVVLCVGLVTPATMLSNAHLELAALASGLVVATAYFAAPTARGRGTIGQRALRIAVIDTKSGRPPTPARSTIRSLVVVVEMLLAVSIALGVVALLEVLSIAASGRSITDRVLGTDVVVL